MQITSSHPVWKKWISGQINPPVTFLCAKIAIGHLKLRLKVDASFSLDQAALELYNIYKKAENIQTAKKDIEILSKF